MDGEKYVVRERDEIRDLGEYDTLLFKTASAAGSSFLAGTILGAITAAWQDVPAVERNVALPALKKTGRIMMNYGLTFAAIGGIFAFTESVAASIRGKDDFWNSALGGAAAGSVLGLRGKRASFLAENSPESCLKRFSFFSDFFARQ
jgi:import inner membrane translocase subunit TIM22